MKHKQLWIFIFTWLLDIIVAGIVIEVLAMVCIGSLVLESIISIMCFVPTILGTECLINELRKNDEELK